MTAEEAEPAEAVLMGVMAHDADGDEPAPKTAARERKAMPSYDHKQNTCPILLRPLGAANNDYFC